ncbi:complex I subunit 5 family protein [Streptomyces sp. NPDC021100]|uniref:complex I subunit 5 family protein n=1 Tax=Streptomyces sp. NPDC021100 TaxID=3365114 RepID=UPI0037BE0DA8
MDRLLPLIVVVPLLGAALLAGAGRRMPRPVAETVGCLCSAASAGLAVAALAGGPHVVWAGDWRPVRGHGVGIVLTGDRTGTGLAALTSLLVVTVLAYAWRYFDEPPRGHTGSFPALILLFQAGMCGFALTGDLFNAFVFFELMGVVGYALTGYRVEEARPVQGALAFGFVNSLGGYASLLGIALLYARTGELGMAQAGRQLDALGRHDALVLASLVLILTGLLIKAAAVPFHFWLPDAHAVAPTPVCMLLSGVMVEMGVYGAARVYVTVFAGPGGVPAEDFRRALTVLGLLTALTGATLCWQQRHLKRLLAFSTVAHTGLFLAGLAALEPDGVTGVFLYVLGHAGVKAALFACTGALLDRYGGVDEHRLHGRAREMRGVGVLYAVGGLALAGLPPFGTALGKALAEKQAVWLTALYVVVSAVTGGAVLRAAARVFLGAGPREEDACGAPETTGDQEEPETDRRVRRLPSLMAAVAALLLAGALAVGTVPALAREAAGAAHAFTDHAGYAATVLDGTHTAPGAGHPYAWWSPAGVGLGLLSALLATGLAALGVRGAIPARRWAAPLRRLHSGHVGDYVACAAAGIGLLSALILWPGG